MRRHSDHGKMSTICEALQRIPGQQLVMRKATSQMPAAAQLEAREKQH